MYPYRMMLQTGGAGDSEDLSTESKQQEVDLLCSAWFLTHEVD